MNQLPTEERKPLDGVQFAVVAVQVIIAAIIVGAMALAVWYFGAGLIIWWMKYVMSVIVFLFLGYRIWKDFTARRAKTGS